MSVIGNDTLVVVDGPCTGLVFGEPARVIYRDNIVAYVFGFESQQYAYVPVSSLSPLEEDYNLFLEVHDYVFEGDE